MLDTLSDRPDRESTADLFPETAMGREEPRVDDYHSVASVVGSHKVAAGGNRTLSGEAQQIFDPPR